MVLGLDVSSEDPGFIFFKHLELMKDQIKAITQKKLECCEFHIYNDVYTLLPIIIML